MQSIIDYFKLHKILDLKKLNKHGDVKITHDKGVGRKVLSVEGNVSTQNYIVFDNTTISNMHFGSRYLYVVGYSDCGRSFCFELGVQVNGKVHKFIYSTIYKSIKQTTQGVVQLPLELKSSKWSVIVVDLFQLNQRFCGGKERLTFKLCTVVVRAHSKVKNIYQSDYLYDPASLPKEIALPLRAGQNYYSLYNYFICGQSNPKLQSPPHPPSPARSPREEKIEEVVIESPKKMPIKGKSLIKTEKVAKKKNISQIEFQQEYQHLPQPQTTPSPHPTITSTLSAIEGCSISSHGMVGVHSYIINPVLIITHKPITQIYYNKKDSFKLVVAYNDGCVGIWHAIKKTQVAYLRTDVVEVRALELVEAEEKLIVVGLDKLKRQLIVVVSGGQLLFKQVSNYSIHGFKYVTVAGKEMILSYGHENVRIWKFKPDKHIISGMNIYLGSMHHKTTYTGCAIIANTAYIIDNKGYITLICLMEQKMDTINKLDQHPLDCIHAIEKQLYIINSLGVIKSYNTELECLMEMDIRVRVKSMSYEEVDGSITLILNHYNKSQSKVDLEQSCLEYVHRCHNGKVTGIGYCGKENKVVSMADDCSVRVWALSANQGSLPFRLKQEYQFLMQGRKMECLAVDSTAHAYVGTDDGHVLKLDLRSYTYLKDELMLPNHIILHMNISKNNKHLLIITKQAKTHEHSILITDNQLNQLFSLPIPYLTQQTKVNAVYGGFNLTCKKIYLCWVLSNGVSRVQTYSLSNVSEVLLQFEVPMKVIGCKYYDQILELYDQHQIHLYHDTGDLISLCSIYGQGELLVNSPLYFRASTQHWRMHVGVLRSSKMGEVKDTVELPQPVSNICDGGILQQQMGIVFCSGTITNSIYAVSYQTSNLTNTLHLDTPEESHQQHLPSEHEQMLPSNSPQQQITFMQEQAQQIHPLYAQQQEMFEECKHILLPQHTQQPIESAYTENKIEKAREEGQLQTTLYYGWQTSYAGTHKQLIWLPQHQSILFVLERVLVLHKFTYPVSQKHVRLAIRPSLVMECAGVVLVSMSKHIRLYTHQLHLMREMEALGEVIDLTITNCQGYLLCLSTDRCSRVFIQVLDIHTGKTISSSYLNMNHQQQPKVLINPYVPTLNFILYTESRVLFYRLSSILTLQYQPLPQLTELIQSVTLSAITYTQIEEEQVLLVGLSDGSVVLVDGRSGTVLLMVKAVMKGVIRAMQVKDGLLIGISQGSSVTVFQVGHTLNQLVRAISGQATQPVTLNTDSDLQSYTQMQMLSSTSVAMLALTKYGVLWMIDLIDHTTVKILSFHAHPPSINKAIPIPHSPYIVSGGEDGIVNITYSKNLEQCSQIYKPRKAATDLLINGDKMLVSFNNQLCFYHLCMEPTPTQSCIGSVTTKSRICSIAHVQESNCYVLASESEICLVYHHAGKKPLKVEIKPIYERTGQGKGSISTYGGSHFMLVEQKKVSVWVKRKQRTIVDQIQEFHRTAYYLMDVYQTNTVIGAQFISPQQYIIGVGELCIQWRDYQQHTILSQLQLNISSPSTLTLVDSNIYVGDLMGNIYATNHNGLIINKKRVFDTEIKAITQMKYQQHATLLVYGQSIAIVYQ